MFSKVNIKHPQTPQALKFENLVDVKNIITRLAFTAQLMISLHCDCRAKLPIQRDEVSSADIEFTAHNKTKSDQLLDSYDETTMTVGAGNVLNAELCFI
jgi:hypothetical protein